MKVSNPHQFTNMAKHFSPRPVYLLTFLIASSFLTSAHDIHTREVSLVREPDESYYILKKSSVVIVCQAKNAAEIVFNCMGSQIPPTSVELKDVSDIDPDLIQAEIKVTRADLQNYEDQSPFWCECGAISIDGDLAVTSRRATVSIANLKNKFEIQPKSATTNVGEEVIFECGAPEGQPKPEIMWRKDKKRLEIENNPRFSVTEKGSLVIQSVMSEDKGYYQCVARNVAGRRESEEAELTVTALAESSEPDQELSGGSAGKKSGKPRTTRQSATKTYFTTEPQEKYFVTQEKPLVIDCGVVAADILTFRCNGKRMDRTRQTINQGLDSQGNRVIQSQLNITYADVQAFLTELGDRQTYQCLCVAWYQDSGSPNGWGRINSSATLGYVYLAYLDEAFQTEPSDVTAALSTDASFACESPKGQPSPWVYWYKDGARLDPRSSQKYSVNDKGHLTIHDVQYEDAGAYNCLAENLVSSLQSRSGTLTVTADASTITTAAPAVDDVPPFPSVIPTTPVFLRDFESENVLSPDDTKTMVCAVVSADQVTIDCGGQRLNVDDYELKQNLHRETGKRLLYVKAVITGVRLANNPDDYFCQCTAWYLNENNTWEKLASNKGYIRQAPEASYIGTEFEVAPVDTDAHFETDAELNCSPPDGSPTPMVYWLKDGVRIDTEADSNFVLSEGNLLIEYVRVTDEGQYTCVAENEAGSRQSQPIQFTVLGKPAPVTDAPGTETYDETTTGSEETEQEGPKFVQELDDEYYIVDNEPVTLSCSVLDVKTLVFVCNGVILRETATTGDSFIHPHTMETIRSNHLTITKEKFDEYEGDTPYICLCRAFYQKDGTVLPSDSSPATIFVAYLRENFEVEPSETAVANLGRLELPCRAPEGFPVPEISWLINGNEVVEDERIRVQDSGTLVIEQFTVEDEGTYTCVANNSFTSRESSGAFVYVSVSSGPDEVVTPPYGGLPVKTDEPKPEPDTTPSEVGKQPSDIRYISKDLHSVYYLVKNKPVTLTCEAYNVESIEFICGNMPVENPEVEVREEESSSPDGTSNLVKIVQATIKVTKEDVEKFGDGSDYLCQCIGNYRVPGIDEFQKLTSVKGFVEVAYLKKNFQKEPENQTVMEGDNLAIQCQPPAGNPTPKVSWTKDGENVEALSITSSGILIIPEVELQHEGEYICIAENDAGKRMSEPIYVDVKAKGGVPPVKGETEESVDEESNGNSETSVHGTDGDAESSVESEDVTETIESNSEDEPKQMMDKSTEVPKGDSDEDMKRNNITVGRSEDDGREDETIVNFNTDETEQEEIEEEGSRVWSKNNNEKNNEGDSIKAIHDGLDENEETQIQNKGNDIDDSYERQDEISMKGEDKGGSLEDKPKMTSQEENASMSGIERQKSIEGNECAQMLSSCSNLLPRNANHVAFCEAVPDYTACVDNYFQKCTGIINEISMNAVKMAYTDTVEKCTLKPKCQKLQECRTISSNLPDSSMDQTGLSVYNLCRETNTLVECVDQNLAECNVTKSPPEEEVRASLQDVDNWLGLFCNTWNEKSRVLESCDEVSDCSLQIEQVAGDNSTYWCNLINSLLECTRDAVRICNLDEVEEALTQLRDEANDLYCSDEELTVSPVPEVNPEPTGEPESKEVNPEPPSTEETTDGGDGEDIDNVDQEIKGNTQGKDKVGDARDDDDRDFQRNTDNDLKDFESAEEMTTRRQKAKDRFNTDVVYEEADTNSEEYVIDRDEDYNPFLTKEETFVDRKKTSIAIEKSEDDDYVYKADTHKTFTENVEGSNTHDEDEDEEQGKSSIPLEASKDPNDASAALRASMFLATILQLLILATISWR